MDVKKFPMLIVGVVVALVLAGAVLPVFAETTSATDTFTNNGYYKMSEIGTGDSWTMVYNSDMPTILTINGYDFDITTVDFTASKSILISNSHFIRIAPSGANYSINLWDSVFKVGFNTGSFIGTVTAELSNNTLTWTVTTDSATVTTYDLTGPIIAFDVEGDQILKDANKSAYLLDTSSIIYAGGLSNLGGGNYAGVYFHSVISEFTVDDINIPELDVIISDFNVNYSYVNSYDDLILFDSVTFTTEYNDTTVQQTYSYVVVPYEVTAEKTVHPDGALSVMLNILPLLAIAGLVTGAVVWFVSRKG